MSRIQRLLPALLLGGLVFAAATSAPAQDWENAGMVRISDNVPADLKPVPAGTPVAQGNCPNCPGGAYGATCPNGCPQPCSCRTECYKSKCLCQIIDWFNPHGMCTFSPDHGFAPPVKRPIYRTPVVYRKNFPDSWTGMGGAPMGSPPAPPVYMPTDTTQLGYYYQHVPYWMPKPGAIPPAPRPADWHLSMCEADLPGRHPAGVILGTTPVMNTQPMPVMQGQPVPPSPEPTPTVSNGGLERTSGAPNLQPIE